MELSLFTDENGEYFVKAAEGLLPNDFWATVAFLATHNPALQEQVALLEGQGTLLSKLIAAVPKTSCRPRR